MQKTKFASHKQYLIGLLFSIKVKEDSHRPKYTSSFLICPNLNDSQTFKSSSCKKIFFSVYVVHATCFDVCFSFYVITGSRYFFNRHIVVFFETSVLKEVRILRYLHNNSVVLILMLMLSSKKSYPILYLYILEKLSYVADFFYDNVFYTLYFFNCSTLFFIKLFLFLKNSKHL